MYQIVESGRVLALFGLILMMVGIFVIPDSWDEFLKEHNARFGLGLAGFIAIVIGMILATIGV